MYIYICSTPFHINFGTLTSTTVVGRIFMGPLQPILVTGLCADQHVLGCSSSSKTKVEGKKDNGLYTRHVYSLLKVMILGSGLVFFVVFGKDGYEESCKHEDFLSFYKLLRDVRWTRQRSSSMIQR